MMLPLILLLSAPLHAGEFMDTWVTLALEDTNVLAGPEHYSPSANFVQRGNRTFFEDYESRYSDDISQAHLVLYRRDEGFWRNWYTEAAMVLQFTPYLDPDQSRDGVDIRDDGSYVRLVRQIGDMEGDNFSITGYAIDANRFRLGYSYDLSWGGREIFSTNPKASPGVRFQYQRGGSYLFLGAKTAVSDQVQESGDKRNQAYYGLLAGAGLALGDHLRLEAGAGSFQQGQFTNVGDTSSPLYGEPITASGVAGQLSWRSRKELDFIQSAELRLYRNSPDFVRDSYIHHRQLDGVGLLVQAEVNYLAHNLLDPASTDSTMIETGVAGDVQTLLVMGTTTLGFDIVYKDLAYILFSVPGFTSNYAIPDIPHASQIYGRAELSHHFPEARVTPAIGVGMMQPATYTTSNGTFVQYSRTAKEGVPAGQDATNILGAVAALQVDASKSLVLVGEVLYTLDNNLSDFVSDGENEAGRRVPADAVERNQLGFNLMMRARF